MFDEILRFLAAAVDFELEAKRLFEANPRSPNWTETYVECLGDARRQRAAARKLVLHDPKNSHETEDSEQGSEAAKWPSEIGSMTLAQLLQLAATARTAPVGSRRLRRAAEQMRQVAGLLQNSKALAQLLWWCAEVQPLSPGRPVIDFDKRENAR